MNSPAVRLLLLLLAIIPIVAILIRNYRAGRRDLGVIAGRGQAREIQNVYLVKSFFGGLFLVLFLTFSVLASVGFSWGQAPVEEDRSGLDIVVLVDVSRSMLSQDVKPSRLDRSRDLIRGLVRELTGARFGVAVFKGSAVAEIPVTEDTVSIDSFMDFLSPQMITTPGSNLEDGIRTALGMFPPGTGRFRTIVVFSDGESLSGDAGAAADEAASEGVKIFSVVAGTPEGSTIPLADGTVVRDASGQPVITKADSTVMNDIAQRSGGDLFRLTDPAVFASLLNGVHRYGVGGGEAGFHLESIPRYRFFLGLALAFLLLHLAVRVVRWRKLF